MMNALVAPRFATIGGKNGTGPRDNVNRFLTRSLDFGKEGLMPNHSTNSRSTSSDCIQSSMAFSQSLYQEQARRTFEMASDADLQPHAWIRAVCGHACLNPQHLVAHQPTHIAYPAGVCVYCGFPAGTRDHLVPRAWTGDTRRSSVAVVPACAECNSRIGTRGTANIDDRRKVAHDSIRKANRELLATPEWSEADLAELGPSLRQHVEAKARKRHAVRARLAWPEDPFYDMRAWQKSGIEDPVALGVIANPVTPSAPSQTQPAASRQAGSVDPRQAARDRFVFGSRARKMRAGCSMTQGKVAEHMRAAGFFAWTDTAVCLVESGRRRTSIEERAALSLILGGSK